MTRTGRRSAPFGLVLVAAGALAGCLRVPALSPGTGPPRADDPLLAQHRLLVEEGQRASRLLPVAPRDRWQTPGNPIAQIPIVPTVSRVARILPYVPNAAPPPCPYDPDATPPQKIASLLMEFPEVSWHVCVRDMYRASLWIGPVHMRRGPQGAWEKVIERAGLAEIFVPYHNVNFRPYDMTEAVHQLDAVGEDDLGHTSRLIQLTNEPVAPTVVTEIRDRGIGWYCSPSGTAIRRAQEFLVWGVLDGGNYDNVVEYGFRDDGAITFRLGNTGYNSTRNPVEPHTHNALWHVEPEISLSGPPRGESAFWLTHAEPSPAASPTRAADLRTPILTESARQWDERDFASLLIESGVPNARGNPVGFEFSPLQNAPSRHFGHLESWTQNDVYVTRARPEELGWIADWTYPDNYLMAYLDGESVVGQDLALWIKTAAHHHPNDEDRSAADLATGATTGVTLMHWSGFIMQPHNLFSANPLGGPERCGISRTPIDVPVGDGGGWWRR